MSEASRKLSTEEVSALMDGLKTGDLSSSTLKNSNDVEVKVFSFGSDDLTLLGDYYALRLINERFARMVARHAGMRRPCTPWHGAVASSAAPRSRRRRMRTHARDRWRARASSCGFVSVSASRRRFRRRLKHKTHVSLSPYVPA